MDEQTQCQLAAVMIEREGAIIEQSARYLLFEQSGAGGSTQPWADVDKALLPAVCYLWVEDPKRRGTWHLPYREGAGGIDPETGRYKREGPVSMGALRAIAAAVGGARTGTPMRLPREIRLKIKRLLRKYAVGEYAEAKANREEHNVEIFESYVTAEVGAGALDKEAHRVKDIVILTRESSNCTVKGGTGRTYRDAAMQDVARLAEGVKVFRNHDIAGAKRGDVRRGEDLIGSFENARFEADKGRVVADLHYLAADPMQSWTEAVVTQMPDKVGMSIFGEGTKVFDNQAKREFVERMIAMPSVDLVTESAATRNLFESQQAEKGDEGDAMDFAKLTVKELQAERPDIIESVGAQVREGLASKSDADEQKRKIDALTVENAALKKTNDDNQVKEAASEKKAKIDQMLKESKLPKEAITDVFRESLETAEDDAKIKARIDERKELIEGAQKGVKGMGPAGKGGDGKDDKVVAESMQAAYKE